MTDFASGVPTVWTSPGGKAARISLKLGSRLNLVERSGNWVLTGYDVPYIWTVLRLRIGCDGRTSATMTYSEFPSLAAYQDGAKAAVTQTADVARFIKSAGHRPTGRAATSSAGLPDLIVPGRGHGGAGADQPDGGRLACGEPGRVPRQLSRSCACPPSWRLICSRLSGPHSALAGDFPGPGTGPHQWPWLGLNRVGEVGERSRRRRPYRPPAETRRPFPVDWNTDPNIGLLDFHTLGPDPFHKKTAAVIGRDLPSGRGESRRRRPGLGDSTGRHALPRK
jgi:hypothetical protein